MPCYRCGVRQVDPVRGHSPWQRGVKGDQQVLVCPDCQAAPGLTADLDHCRKCGSVRLVRRLGEVECRACGFVVPPEGGAGRAEAPAEPVRLDAGSGVAEPDMGGGVKGVPGGVGGPSVSSSDVGRAPGLAEEVAQALERVLGRNAAKPPASAVTPLRCGAYDRGPGRNVSGA
jgi:ribosomal protein L40E